jgi:aryl-alcohol dehydrogenase-like predicted oxidoreductase
VSRIDLYQLHRIDANVPLADQIGVLTDMQAEGKIAHIGLSQVTLADLAAVRELAPVVSVQNLYNLKDRSSQDVLDQCSADGTAFIPWFPVAAGPLADPGGPLASVAARTGHTPSQLSLAWLLARSPVMLPIPGTSSMAHLAENCAAADIELDQATLAELEAIR